MPQGVTLGSLGGTVTDKAGEPLPGVVLTLGGVGNPRSTVTNARGDYRFDPLRPGEYTLKAELEGFRTVEHPHILIRLDDVTLDITLAPAAAG